MLSISFFLFCGSGDQTQHLMHSRQTFNHQATSPTPGADSFSQVYAINIKRNLKMFGKTYQWLISPTPIYSVVPHTLEIEHVPCLLHLHFNPLNNIHCIPTQYLNHSQPPCLASHYPGTVTSTHHHHILEGSVLTGSSSVLPLTYLPLVNQLSFLGPPLLVHLLYVCKFHLLQVDLGHFYRGSRQ